MALVWIFLVDSRLAAKTPDFRRLDFLGFPWILLSETSVFNWLSRIFVENIFASLFPVENPLNGSLRSRPWGSARLFMGRA